MATEPDTQNSCPVNKEGSILPTTQMEGVCLGVKSSHQSLSNPVPHGEQENP